MSTKSLAAIVLLLSPLLGAVACSTSTPDAVEVDGVISSRHDGKNDLIGALWQCKASCECDDGTSLPVRYAACAATDVEAGVDGNEACVRACTVRGAGNGASVKADCEPTDKTCGYPSPIGSTDLASPYGDGGYENPDFGYAYPVDLSSASDLAF